jgi:hypothetical protein
VADYKVGSPASILATILRASTSAVLGRYCLKMRIPTKPAMHSNLKPATCSDAKPAGIPI